MTRSALLAIAFVLAAGSLRAAGPVVSLSATGYTFHENDGVDTVTVNRTGDPLVSFSVNYETRINDVGTTGVVTFGPNELTKQLTLTIPNDDVFDSYSNSQGYFVALRPTTGVTLGTPSSAFVTLIEDEPRPTISVADIAVVEGNSGSTDVHMNVTFSGPFKRSESLYSFGNGGTASVKSDYEGGYSPDSTQFLIVPIQARQTSAQLTIRIHGDNLPEPDETIIVSVGFQGSQGSGVLTILNDDYLLAPASQKVSRGSVGTFSITTTVPTPTTDRVALSSSDPSIATVPPFIDIPAGSLGKSFDVTTVGNGSAVITATMPPSRGSAMSTARVDVFTDTQLTFDRQIVDVALAATTTVTAHFDPPPDVPVVLFLSQSNPAIASVSQFFTVGTNGAGSIAVRGLSVGATSVTMTLPAEYGGATYGFAIVVSPPAGVAITRLDTVSGPSSGGQRVTIFAFGMSTRCSAMFDGVSGLNTSTSASGSLTTYTPPHDAGSVDVSVRCGADTGTLPKAYTYTPVPIRLTRLSPTIGPAGGGVLVAATGENLRRGRCSLWFGGITATTLQNDQATTMLVAAPPHAPGSVDVTIRCGSDVSTLAGAFLYTGGEMLPQLAGVNPPSAAPGDRVIVGGSAFRDDDVIFFDNVAGLDVTSTSDQHLVTVPDLPPGNTTITLRDVAGHIAAGPVFRVLAPIAPQITSAPTHVLTSSELQVTGSGFRRSLNFLLGGTVLQQVSVASTFALLRLPDSIVPGIYTLTIANQNVTPRTIEVTEGISVTSITIPCSSTEGGPMAKIRGNGFAAGAVVAFGASDSSDVTVQDAHTIVAKVPPSSGLAVEAITVTNPTGESAQLSNAFRYRWPDPGCGTTRHRGATH